MPAPVQSDAMCGPRVFADAAGVPATTLIMQHRRRFFREAGRFAPEPLLRAGEVRATGECPPWRRKRVQLPSPRCPSLSRAHVLAGASQTSRYTPSSPKVRFVSMRFSLLSSERHKNFIQAIYCSGVFPVILYAEKDSYHSMFWARTYILTLCAQELCRAYETRIDACSPLECSVVQAATRKERPMNGVDLTWVARRGRRVGRGRGECKGKAACARRKRPCPPPATFLSPHHSASDESLDAGDPTVRRRAGRHARHQFAHVANGLLLRENGTFNKDFMVSIEIPGLPQPQSQLSDYDRNTLALEEARRARASVPNQLQSWTK
ncbi:Protein of unknown function [Gryllus bimaculatus]|nr:Protein of unknown function [Gryllus bimaculatus]